MKKITKGHGVAGVGRGEIQAQFWRSPWVICLIHFHINQFIYQFIHSYLNPFQSKSIYSVFLGNLFKISISLNFIYHFIHSPWVISLDSF